MDDGGRDEALSRLVKDLSGLAAAAKNLKLEEENLTRFSQLIADVKDLRIQLESKQTCHLDHGFIANILKNLDTEVQMVRKVIDDYNSETLLNRLVMSRILLSKLNRSAKSMAATLRLLPLSHETKASAVAVIHELETTEFKFAADAEAYQLLDSSATASPSPRASTDEDISSPHSSFLRSFDGELLTDPVSVSCGHSFERRTIEEHLRLGNYWCPECNKELSPTEELTPNTALRKYILEKKQRNAVKKLRHEASLLPSEDSESLNRALADLSDAMTVIPSCIAKAKEYKLIPVLALLLMKSSGNTRAVLSCLRLIARFSDENKETMGTTGVIRCLMKLLRGAEPEPYALEILLEISKKEVIADKIGNDPNSIPILVSLLNHPIADMAEMARSVLENLSKTQFTITMARCGYFSPFLELFCRGNSEETRASMANELARMKLTELSARSLENDQFITCLIELLGSSSPSSKSASLHCIKQLIAFSVFRSRFLSNEFAIPAILNLITGASEQQWKQEVAVVLASLIQTSQPTDDHQNKPKLQVLYTSNAIRNLLLQIETSGFQDQISLLKLLHLIVQTSDSARKPLKSEDGAMSSLFSALKRDQNDDVRLHVLKLIYYIASADPNEEISLPPSPAKDSFVNSLIDILTHSCVEEERSAAAGIIGYLPTSDHSIDEMLQKSAFLKAVNEIFSLAIHSNGLLENSLAALQRYVVCANSVPHKQIRKLHPHLVQMLSNGASPLAKQHAAITLSHLASCSSISSSSSLLHLRQRIGIPKGTQSSKIPLCPVHLSSSICLIKIGAVKPLVEMVRTMEPGSSAAALMTLNTLCNHCDSTLAAEAILESGGAAAIIEVLERGPVAVKEAALELLEKICKHPRIKADGLDEKFDRVLVYLISKEDQIKVKAASVRADIGFYPGPS